MLTGNATAIATQYYQPRAGGDIAVMMGMARALFAWNDEAKVANQERILDVTFITEHTHGFVAFEETVRSSQWEDIVREAAVSRSDIEEAARTYARVKSVIAIYGMGLTQHRLGVDTYIC